MEEGPGPAPKAATQAAQKNLFWAASTALTNRSRISLPSRKVYLLDCCTNCNCNAMQGRAIDRQRGFSLHTDPTKQVVISLA